MKYFWIVAACVALAAAAPANDDDDESVRCRKVQVSVNETYEWSIDRFKRYPIHRSPMESAPFSTTTRTVGTGPSLAGARS